MTGPGRRPRSSPGCGPGPAATTRTSAPPPSCSSSTMSGCGARDFTRACVRSRGRETWIDWQAARAFADAGTAASTSEMAIPGLAVALGENRYRLSIMGAANARSIATAVARAAGVTP